MVYIGKTKKEFEILGYQLKPQKLLKPDVQILTRLIDRPRRLRENGADSHLLRQYVQRWVSWLHSGLQGAVNENRFNQVWHYVNLKLSDCNRGTQKRGPLWPYERGVCFFDGAGDERGHVG